MPTLEEKVKFTDLKNLEIINVKTPGFDFSHELNLTIAPGEEKIVLMKKAGLEQSSYKA